MGYMAIIGGGPAGLMAANVLAEAHEVDLHEQGRTVGRKFLVAGDGGLNLTHGMEADDLLAQYTPAGFLDPVLAAFGPKDLRRWLADMGVPTYIGTSGRVFPQRGIKPAEVLKAIRDRLRERGVRFLTGSTFVGFDQEARPIVEREGIRSVVTAERVLFALGGASWPRTGSRGDWRPHFEAIGVRTKAFAPSNCGVEVAWPESLLRHHAGKPLKNVRVTAGDPSDDRGLRSLRGEATITRHGLEGNAIYPVVPMLRHALQTQGFGLLQLDLKPDLSNEVLLARLGDAPAGERASLLKLDRAAWALLKACTSKEEFEDPERLAHAVKHLRITVTGLRPIEEAISTVGGIDLASVAPNFSLKGYPQLFVAGEMLDVDAPTGGFLLQAAFSMGHWAAQGMLGAK